VSVPATGFQRIAVIGAGSWGTTVANLLAGKSLDVRIWAREPELGEAIAKSGENQRYLPGVTLHPGLRAVPSRQAALEGADLLVLAIPAQSLRDVVRQMKGEIRDGLVIINLAKGIEEGTGARCSEIVHEEIRQANPIGVLSGPNIAWEIVRGTPSKAVVACSNYRFLPALRETFSTPGFKVYECPDLTGCELGGAIKNVMAIMAGIGDGLGYGVNTKAAVMTRGLQEMVRIGVVMGGHRETFFGLSGIGDLMTTSLSEHSRNRTLGEGLGRGLPLEAAEARLNGRVAEGIKTTRALYEIKQAFDLETPILDSLHRILYEGLPAREGYLGIWDLSERFEAQ
jgi:glycerol-3-phosphate dehydrogenase (NAD(P)+)